MSQGGWGGGGNGGWGGQPPAPPGGGYGQPPAPPGGGYGQPPGGGYGQPPGGGYGQPPGGYGQPPGGFAPPPMGAPPGFDPHGGAGNSGMVPWEDSNLGFFSRWGQTIKGVCFTPGEFFEAGAANENPWPAILFNVLTAAFVGLLFGIFAAVMLATLMAWMSSFFGGSSGAFGPMMMAMGASGVLYVVIYPLMYAFIAFAGPFIQGGIQHVILMIFGGTTRSYLSTVRVVAYSYGTFIWYIIPCIGWLGGFINQIVSNTAGLDRTHRSGMGKAFAAVFVPIATCCLCYFVYVMVAGTSSARYRP